ncbi:MAG: TldD/PmbA family protein, partial [Candidatus Thorarchaeota archaeon]|nr:TldD/PmbA family protein [Candidatus Thorarchaeota archaeon]
AVRMAKASASIATLKLPFDSRKPVTSERSDTPSVKMHPRDVALSEKVDLVNRVVESARASMKNSVNITGMYGELYGPKYIASSDHTRITWDLLVTDLRVRATAKTDRGELVMGTEGIGGSYGLEQFKEESSTPESLGRLAAEHANEQLEAKSCPAGKFRGLVENRLAGVLAHESFGHLSEADFVVTGGSPLTGKTGAQLGTEHVTIVDGGRVDVKKHGGLWLPYDDQGITTGKTIVMDKGVLRHYLHSRGTAKRLGQEPTGNARAVDFTFSPIVRMTNTYFAAGDLSEEEALELLDTGVYAIQSFGGQVSGDGSFLFSAARGYWVENGEKKYPIREVALSGNILDLLGRVMGATRDLRITSGYFGGCGKGAQVPLPVGLGGPMMVIDGIVFGGKA